MEKIIAPKSIKKGLFKSLKSGLCPEFYSERNILKLNSVLANILLNGIELIHPCIRIGRKILIFLKPEHNEKKIIKQFILFLSNLGIICKKNSFQFISPSSGFNVLNWNFQITKNKEFYSSPTSDKYKQFRKKVKTIINNSNYGAKTKANKLFPIVNEWNFQNRLCNTKNSKYSLFILKRRAFKVFNKEVKQDRYSCKRLVDKAFPNSKNLQNISYEKKSLYSNHVFFYVKNSTFEDKQNKKYVKKLFCLHCGLKYEK